MNLSNLNRVKVPLFLLSIISLFSTSFLSAEGSIDLIKYNGKRLFMNVEQQQQLKVYAAEGEFINFGASHVGISGGFIKVYKPDGQLWGIYDNTSASAGLAIIENSIQEKNGPNGGGNINGNGYKPGIVQVQEGDGGVWTFVLGYPSYTKTVFKNLNNTDQWTRDIDQPTNRRVVLSWDITVSKYYAVNNGGQKVKGRVYSNEYNSILNENDNFTSPKFYVLSKSGYVYIVEFYDTDPWGFPLCSNNFGIVDSKGNPIYKSLKQVDFSRSTDPATWQSGNFYLYEPQARDLGAFVNNKVFFNVPDITMPTSALVTDVERNDTHTTWLMSPLGPGGPTITQNSFKPGNPIFNPCPAGFIQEGDGGLFIFKTNTTGSIILKVDLDNDGIFDGPLDRIFNATAHASFDTIYWDGKYGNGQVVTEQQNFTLSYKLTLRTGEIHILMSDIETNPGGVTITRLNGPASPINEFYYDHSAIGGAVSGNGTPGHPNPTSVPFTYTANFGNEKLLDYWSYVDINVSGAASFDIYKECTKHYPDTDGDGLTDNIDLDDENDGIADYLEFCFGIGTFSCLPGGKDPSHDEDGDYILNYLDAKDAAINNNCPDVNNDGICDLVLPVYDLDGDGVPNHLDLDNDNDGIPDIDETGFVVPDINRDGVIDFSPGAFGTNGFYTLLSTDPDSQNAKSIKNPKDKDGDNIPDHLDRDSDNDGIYDLREAGYINHDGDNNGGLDDGTGNVPLANAQGLLPYLDPALTGIGIAVAPDFDHDGYQDYNDLDADNDGINDVGEATGKDSDNDGIIGFGLPKIDKFGIPIQDANGIPVNSTSKPADSDNDTKADYTDLDSDNDGLFDCAESGFTDPDNNGTIGFGIPNTNINGQPISDATGTKLDFTSTPRDQDQDGIPDFRDLDRDGDMIADQLECPNGGPCPDNDLDDVADVDDLDADNDGILDIAEYGYSLQDLNNDGMYDGNYSTPLLISANGFPKLIDPALTGKAYPARPDHDLDGIADVFDRDSDNDGINDVYENSKSDNDNDGIIGTGTLTVNSKGVPIKDANGNNVTSTSILADKDKDNVANFIDLDSDNDGISDVSEAQLPDSDGNGRYGNAANIIINIFGQASDFNGNIFSISLIPDVDLDGNSDAYDSDSDNDGLYDITENGQNQFDSDHNGTIDDGNGNLPLVGDNGLADIIDPDVLGTPLNTPLDFDKDKVPDYRDLDSDNDGINDDLEAIYQDIDGDGHPGTSPLIVNECGVILKDASNKSISYNLDLKDNDNDGKINGQDLDSDGDGLKDVVEAGLKDPDNNGLPGTGAVSVNPLGQPETDAAGVVIIMATNPWDHDGDKAYDFLDRDSDGDGIFDQYECATGWPCSDKDLDGIVDIYDLDSDNDGISDLADNGLFAYDANHDGILDDGNGNPGITDEHGLPDFLNTLINNGWVTKPRDSDKDGYPDYNDLDSENDGINDVEESLLTDADNDGIMGIGIPLVNGKGQPVSDGNGSPLVFGTKPLDTDGDGYINQIDFESDGDGLTDASEALIPDPDGDGIAGKGNPVVNTNGQPIVSGDGTQIVVTSNPPDWDGDGFPDPYDIDSDNDGIDDGTECPGGVPCPDTDGDGNVDGHDLDSDGDGLTDTNECPNGDPCPDPDGDGTPEWIDFNCNGNWIPAISNLASIIQVCEGKELTISADNLVPVPGNIIYTWTGPNNFYFTDTTSATGPFEMYLPFLSEKFEGYYSLTLTTEKGCTAGPQQVYVNYGLTPSTPIISADINPLCQGETLVLNSTIASGLETHYHWYIKDENGQKVLISETENPTLVLSNPLDGTQYFVEVSTDGCYSQGSNLLVASIQSAGLTLEDELFNVEHNPGIKEFNVLANDTYSGNPKVTFFNTPADIKVLKVDNGKVTLQFSEYAEGFYELNYLTCSTLCPDYCDTATLRIIVNPISGVPADSLCDAPNIFTPNEDGDNDNFIVPCLEKYRDNKMQIFNRWGDVVFEKENYNNDWKGTYNNNPLPAGTYYYLLRVDELKKTFTGFITLIR